MGLASFSASWLHRFLPSEQKEGKACLFSFSLPSVHFLAHVAELANHSRTPFRWKSGRTDIMTDQMRLALSNVAASASPLRNPLLDRIMVNRNSISFSSPLPDTPQSCTSSSSPALRWIILSSSDVPNSISAADRVAMILES